MNYFDDMRGKHGFNDGEMVPAEAWKLRKLYARLINRRARRLGSAVRIEEYDRPGALNHCMLLVVSEGERRECAPDDAMCGAFRWAEDNIDDDDLLGVTVRAGRRAVQALLAKADALEDEPASNGSAAKEEYV
jgi:hypothetical protein